MNEMALHKRNIPVSWLFFEYVLVRSQRRKGTANEVCPVLPKILTTHEKVQREKSKYLVYLMIYKSPRAEAGRPPGGASKGLLCLVLQTVATATRTKQRLATGHGNPAYRSLLAGPPRPDHTPNPEHAPGPCPSREGPALPGQRAAGPTCPTTARPLLPPHKRHKHDKPWLDKAADRLCDSRHRET